MNTTMQRFEYMGNVHIHSSYSDGSGSVQTIARYAKQAGLDFIIFNDHDYMAKMLHVENEGILYGLRVLVGLELGKRFHHYLAFGLKRMVRGRGLSPQEVIDHVNEAEGFGFLAHPFEKGMPFREKSIAYTWNDVSVKNYTGICIWNFSSRWKERVKTPIHGLFFLLFKAWALKGPSRKTLLFWDAACRKRPVVAIGGSDAHGALFRWGPLRFTPLSYLDGLKSINIHVILSEPMAHSFEMARDQIYHAMRKGSLFIAHDRLSCAKGFDFYYESNKGCFLGMGEESVFEPGSLFVKSPESGRIRLLRNGNSIADAHGKRDYERSITRPGVYRVEIYRRVPFFGLRPWIFSNPIYLR